VSTMLPKLIGVSFGLCCAAAGPPAVTSSSSVMIQARSLGARSIVGSPLVVGFERHRSLRAFDSAILLRAQSFDKPLAFEPFDDRAVDELLRIAARRVGVFLAEIFENQFDAVE